MSDFGALIIFRKASGTLSAEDKTLILDKLNEAVKNGEHSSHIKGAKYSKLIDWDENLHAVMLTEYFDDEDADEVREFAEEEDIDEANEIIAVLETSLGTDFKMEAVFTDW
jgi:hypothetical protein